MMVLISQVVKLRREGVEGGRGGADRNIKTVLTSSLQLDKGLYLG